MKELKSEVVNKALDRITEGGTYTAISKDSGVSRKTIYDLIRDFPLWGWHKDKADEVHR